MKTASIPSVSVLVDECPLASIGADRTAARPACRKESAYTILPHGWMWIVELQWEGDTGCVFQYVECSVGVVVADPHIAAVLINMVHPRIPGKAARILRKK